MINVTKSFLPPLEVYTRYLEGIWERGHLTNHGPLVNELEEKIKEYLGVKHFFFLNNGTIAIQIAIRALDLKGEIITTPFSYVATTSSITWEQASPVFIDIDKDNYTIDAEKIEAAISDKTTGILATHVYGIPCDVEAIQKLADKHGLKVIYDAAHAFGVSVNNKGIMNYGDLSTVSFHATKLFHTVEGGGIGTNDDALAHRISYMRNFGHKGQEDFWGMGINGKNSEFHAAMGLCLFPHINDIIARRKEQSMLYEKYLAKIKEQLQRPSVPSSTDYNYAYFPVVFNSEKQLLQVRDALNASYIYPRRYFYPALNQLPYVAHQAMPVAESIAARVLCLPLYHDLTADQIKQICHIITDIIMY
ncbi:MAG TPA: DegT/DnrJ/EryC1/StrS family aminotransferase [Chitinophagaceae bacterium]|jgi:dTDP-4-amino-4,6-dideoxygalactose transaminase|nr:DegT/DnrJ/EryC1/StrS family aminotransferase [Chitinophagaceae bacterium]